MRLSVSIHSGLFHPSDQIKQKPLVMNYERAIASYPAFIAIYFSLIQGESWLPIHPAAPYPK